MSHSIVDAAIRTHEKNGRIEELNFVLSLLRGDKTVEDFEHIKTFVERRRNMLEDLRNGDWEHIRLMTERPEYE